MPLELRGLCPLLQVFDMPTSLAFYRDVLGFRVVQAAPADRDADRYEWAWLARDGMDLMLNTAYDPDAERPDVPDAARVAAHGDTALYLGCPDVDGAYAWLRARGVAAGPPTVAPYGMKQLYLTDPDGYGVCLQWEAAPAPGAAPDSA